MATFQVSDKTTKILKNFAAISNSLILAPGKSQRTISKGKSMLALAELPEAWPVETPIYDMNRFLGTLSAVKHPNIEFAEDRMKISGGRVRAGFRLSDPSTIAPAPSKTLPYNDPKVTFTLTEADLDQLGKLIAQLESDTVTVFVENGAVRLQATDAKNPAAHDSELFIDTADVVASTANWSTQIAFSADHIGYLMTGAYTVSIADWKYGFFQHKTEPVAYFIVAQS